MAKLKGKKELNARLKALRLAFKPIGKEWGEKTVVLSRPQVPAITGNTRRSLRVRHANQKRATVSGSFVAGILNSGAKAHDIRPKKAGRLIFTNQQGKTIFARKVHHRGVKGSRYAQRAGREALRRTPAAVHLIKQWNKAA